MGENRGAEDEQMWSSACLWDPRNWLEGGWVNVWLKLKSSSLWKRRGVKFSFSTFRDNTRKLWGSWRQKQVCDALRCSGLHARYNDKSREWMGGKEGEGEGVKSFRFFGRNSNTRWMRNIWQILEILSYYELLIETIWHEKGMPSRCKSSTCADYVPVSCTHRPSLLPIETNGEKFGESGFRNRFTIEVF